MQCAQTIWKRFNDSEFVEVRKHPGAANMSSLLAHRNIVRLARSGLHLTAADIRRQVSKHEGPNLSVDRKRQRLRDGTDGIKFVDRPGGNRYYPRHRLPTVKSGRGSVTVHGSFCDKGVGPFGLIEGNTGFKIYINIIETVIRPYCPKRVHCTTGQ
ncbi:hypothetical protein TELCIR_22016 [Teladorsagia circumcincta]|uniref:Uncharacterized protein n=1 Tax=Teladorsagia circumcincta TaxID=45464 RepID=A0A2G9TF37_TELCI|nr:hypothetical protein TELCIR_22016 [Teladorsagia circumcincta]